MALSKDKKNIIVEELVGLLDNAKMTVIVKYEGTTVKAIQELRRNAEDNNSTIKVVKNRLVIKALQLSESHKNSKTEDLKGMLMYVFNADDEVAPAQVIHNMAKTETQLDFVGAFNSEGNYLTAEEVSSLAQLPSKEIMISSVINTLNSPVNDVISGLQGNLHALLEAVAVKAS